MFISRKRGISEIVTTILIVVLVLVAVILVWSFIQPTLNTLSGLKEVLSGSLSPVVSSDAGSPLQQNRTPPINESNFCSECGDGLLNLCDRDECNNFNVGGCYYVAGSCNVCSSVSSCNNFTDGQTCQDLNTNNTCGFSCLWNGTTCYGSGSGFCGDSIVQLGEQCDDGNIVNGDGCDDKCNFEFCGDDICSSTENCDSCSIDCGTCIADCGNGVKDGSEECDDGNLDEWDGCSSLCKIQCSDSDGGHNYYMKGSTVAYNSNNTKEEYLDYCNPNNFSMVIEYYCTTDIKVKSVVYNCSGTCSDGACVGGGGGNTNEGWPACAGTDDPGCGEDESPPDV